MTVIRRLLNAICDKSILYKINRIKACKEHINTSVLYNTSIAIVYNSGMDNILKCTTLLSLMNNTIKILDETTSTIPTSLSIVRLDKKQTVLDLVTIENRIPSNYVDDLMLVLDRYEVLYSLYKEMNLLDVEEQYNSKIVHIYIIILDEIIQSIYENIKLR